MKPVDRTELFNAYANKWVALTEKDEVIASGDTLESAVELAKQKGYASPVIARIPDPQYSYILAI